METSRRKKFCLSKRVEEYHFIESESDELSNSEEDYSSICKIFHQKALKRSKKLEIEEKFKNEFERREASIAKYAQLNAISSDEDYSTTNNYSTRSNQITSTPRVNALRPINKTLALSQIEKTSQILPTSYKTINQSYAANHITNHINKNEQYQEPFTNARTTRKSMVRRQSVLPFERLRKLANDSPYMSPLSPNPTQVKRMKRRATMMSAFKTYCEINTQTSPLDHPRKSISIDERFSNNMMSNNNGNKSDSSSASIISFSKAVIDEPEDIYINNNGKRNELKLTEQEQNDSKVEQQIQTASLRSDRISRSSLIKSRLKNDSNINSFSFDPSTQNNKRSTAIQPLESHGLSKKSIARNSEIMSDKISESTNTSQSKLRSRKSGLSNASKQSKMSEPASPSKHSKSLISPSKMTKSLLDLSKATKSLSKSSKINADSEIRSIPQNIESTTINSTSCKKLTKKSVSLSSNASPEKVDDEMKEDDNNNFSIDNTTRKNTRLLNNSRISTPKASCSSKSLSRNSSLVKFSPKKQNKNNTNSLSKSSKSIKSSTFIEANDKKSEILSKIENDSSSSEIILNTDSEIISNQSLEQSSFKKSNQVNSEVKTITTNSTNSNQESSSNSFKSTFDMFINDEKIGNNNSEILTNNESNIESNINESQLNRSQINRSQINESIIESEMNELETRSKINESQINKSIIKSKINESNINESNINESNINEPSINGSDKSHSIEAEIDLEINNDSKISSTIKTNIDSTESSNNDLNEFTNLKEKVNSEIFSDCINDLNDSFNINKNIEKGRDQSLKSAIPDFSFGNDYEIDDNDFNPINEEMSKNNKYSKIESDDEPDDENTEEEESSNEMPIDETNFKKSENDKLSKEISIANTDESLSKLENSSFSRIEPNCSKISVSFEPSINNSIENHLDKKNYSEIVSDQESNDEDSKDQDEQQSNLNTDFKKPDVPKKRSRQPTVKQQQKYYETFVNKTPTIIYPSVGNNEDNDDEESSIRRSSRIRVRPLEYWRNQKLNYKLDSETKCFTIEGVEKGFKPDNPFKKKHIRPPNPNKRKLKHKNSKLPKIKEENEDSESDESSATDNDQSSEEEEEHEPIKKVRYAMDQEESIHQDVNESAIVLSEKIKREASEFYSKQDLVWNPSRQSKGVYIALMNRKKSANNGIQASGFIKMEPFAEKPRQLSSDYITKYVIMFGAVSVQIADKPTVFLKTMDSFTVEKHTLYSIRNLRKDEALLYFDVCRSK